jgi:hypothetical protein
LPALGVNSRVDLIYENGGALVRVQCTTSRVVGGAIVFPRVATPRTCGAATPERSTYSASTHPQEARCIWCRRPGCRRGIARFDSNPPVTASASACGGPMTTCSARPDCRPPARRSTRQQPTSTAPGPATPPAARRRSRRM